MLPGEAGKARILICMTLDTTEVTFENLNWILLNRGYSAWSKMFCIGCGYQCIHHFIVHHNSSAIGCG